MAVASAARCGSPPRRRTATSASAIAACAARWAAGPFFAMDCGGALKVADPAQSRRLPLVGMGRALLLQAVRHAAVLSAGRARTILRVGGSVRRSRRLRRSTSQIFIDEKPGLLRLRQQDPQHDRRRGVRGLRARRATGRRGSAQWPKTSATSPSTSGRSIRRRMACCAWCWNSTARSSSASIRISGCCTAAPRS